jgi:glycosyltransferase involved in cell wall biosynthesis
VEDYVLPDNFDENRGFSIETVNKIYNASDVIVSTTLGEGWGLSSTEAMAAKVPVIFPDNTSLSEILADNRGRLVRSGDGANDWVCLGTEDMNQYRPVTDTKDMVNALVEAYDNRDKSRERAERAFQWVQDLSWEKIGLQWAEVFSEAVSSLADQGIPLQEVGRNAPCPECARDGVQKKWKKCRKHNPEALSLEVGHGV